MVESKLSNTSAGKTGTSKSQVTEWMQALKNKYVNDATRKTGFTTYLPEGISPDQAAGLINQLVDTQIMNAATGQDKSIKPGNGVLDLMKAKIAKLKTSNPMLFEQYTEEQINIIQTEIVNAWVAVKGNGLPPLTEAEKAAMKAKAEKKIADMKNSQMSEWTKAVRDKYVKDAARKTGMTTFLPEGVTPDQAASLVGQLVNEQIMVAATQQQKGTGFDTARKLMKDKIAQLKTSNPKLFEQYTEQQLNIIQTEIVNAWVAVKGTGLPPLTEAEKAEQKAKG